MKLRMRFVFLPVVVLAGGGAMMVQVFQQSQVGYHHLDEFLAKKESLRGAAVQISGHVLPGSIRKDLANRRVTFTMVDRKTGGTLAVLYPALTLPDTFKDDAPVTAQGRLPAGGEVFEAFEGGVAAKCPSKYEAEG